MERECFIGLSQNNFFQNHQRICFRLRSMQWKCNVKVCHEQIKARKENISYLRIKSPQDFLYFQINLMDMQCKKFIIGKLREKRFFFTSQNRIAKEFAFVEINALEMQCKTFIMTKLRREKIMFYRPIFEENHQEFAIF